MTEEKRRIMENSVTIQRDPEAYKRFKHNMECSKKYGPGQRMDLYMKPPKPEKVIKFEFSSEQCRALADIFKRMIDNGSIVLEGDEDIKFAD